MISAHAFNFRLAPAVEMISRVGRWWLAEFLAMFPPRLAAWLAGRGRKALIVSLEGERVCLRLKTNDAEVLASAQVDRALYSPTSIDQFLVGNRLGRADVDIGLRLPAEQYFRRSFYVPLEAGRSIEKVVSQDSTRRTPFRLDDIYHDFSVDRSTSGKIEVTQWVTRRAAADEAMRALELRPESVAFLAADADDPSTPMPYIRLLRDRTAGRSWLGALGFALVLAAFLLAVSTVGLKLWQQQLLLDELDGQLAIVKPKAQQVRTLVSKLERKQALIFRLHARKRDSTQLLDAWEEATRILPDHTWLIELRLAEGANTPEQHVVLSGFSSAAASLVGLIDASPMFSDAALVSPIARDNTEDRERFSMQAKLRARPRDSDTP